MIDSELKISTCRGYIPLQVVFYVYKGRKKQGNKRQLNTIHIEQERGFNYVEFRGV